MNRLMIGTYFYILKEHLPRCTLFSEVGNGWIGPGDQVMI